MLARGQIPCDVLFIGEAPGVSEDLLGQPFIGPAGKLLDQQIAEALENVPGLELRICFTNLICCIPKEDGKKVGEPSKDSVEACKGRLREFVHLCKPRLVVLVGDHAKKYIAGQADFSYSDDDLDLPWLDGDLLRFECITHPAAILRAREKDQVRVELMYNRVVVILESVFRELEI